MRELLAAALKDRYLIERELGKGGMGAVYLAQDQRLQRQVAIKLLPPEYAVREELRERFLRETRMVAGFSHPNIVPVFAVEEHGDLLAFVMGFIEGETLTQRVRRAGPLNAAEAIRTVQQVAWALSYAHGRDVVHRDIKPDNILIERATGRALVTDFGIARSSSAPAVGGGMSNTLTRVGEVVGTPQFMSPEQAAGEHLDGRSDVYSLGVTAFFAVTGRLPFDAESAMAVMAMHLTQPAPKVATLRPDLPTGLSAAIDRCLEKDPANRFQSGGALADALDALRASRPEIAPTLRIFQQQTTQALRAILFIAFLEALFAVRPLGGGNADRAIPIVVGLAIAWGIAAQMIGRARAVLRTGYSFDDAAAAFRAIIAERVEARDQELADPRARRQNAVRQRIIVGGILYSAASWYWALSHMRTQVGPDSYTLGPVGALLLLSSVLTMGLTIAMIVVNSTRATMLDRVVAWLWRGPLGRFAFRRAARGLWARAGASGVGAAAVTMTSSARALFAELPASQRRQLGDAKARIQKLEQTAAGWSDRQRQLDDAIAEAGVATPSGGDERLGARRVELRHDLTRARADALSRRERLTSALENVRLQLLRLKSGVGSGADVVAELETAEALTD